MEAKHTPIERIADRLQAHHLGNPIDNKAYGEMMSDIRLAYAERDALLSQNKSLKDALKVVTQRLIDLHAAIEDQSISSRFVDDSINMMSEGTSAIITARAALALEIK